MPSMTTVCADKTDDTVEGLVKNPKNKNRHSTKIDSIL